MNKRGLSLGVSFEFLTAANDGPRWKAAGFQRE